MNSLSLFFISQGITKSIASRKEESFKWERKTVGQQIADHQPLDRSCPESLARVAVPIKQAA